MSAIDGGVRTCRIKAKHPVSAAAVGAKLCDTRWRGPKRGVVNREKRNKTVVFEPKKNNVTICGHSLFCKRELFLISVILAEAASCSAGAFT
jgi:hypothetical protein